MCVCLYFALFVAYGPAAARRVAQVCRRNGGVYVKAGQFGAAFGGVPREYRTVLSQLEDRAVPKPYKMVRRG